VENLLNVTNSITFTNSAPITINDNQPGSPYPATIHVGCLWPDDVTKVQVCLNGVTHTYPSDMCILLQGPTGVTTPLIINAGGGSTTPIQNIDLVFDDSGTDLPFNTPLTSGVYHPSAYGLNVAFPPPASGYTNIGLSQFSHENSHGDWNLFVFDDRIIDSGRIAGGWTLTLFVSDAHPPYFISPHCDTNGMFCTTLIGEANRAHVIEASPDLSNWTPVATNNLPDGTFMFTNPSPSTLLFYRAVRLNSIEP
jgi:subtilisin-like proprotein convertase family protein